MNQILNSKKLRKATLMLVFICIAVVMFVILSFSFALATTGSDKIVGKVKIDGILVEGLTIEEARALLKQQENKIGNSIIKLTYEEFSLTIIGRDLGVELNIDDAIDEAYNYGRRGNILVNNYAILYSTLKGKDIQLVTNLKEEKFNYILDEINKSLSEIVSNDTYEIKENKLVISKGKAGIQVKEDELKQQIMSNITKGNAEVRIPTENANPVRLDIDALYTQIHKEPKDASYENINGTFQVNKEEDGLSFDKESVKQEYEKVADGDKIEIALEVTKPKTTIIDLNEVLFKDVLASYETKYDKYYTTRAENLRLAAEKINGTILYPGDIFSYNKVVGPRTAAAGFKLAHVFEGGRVVDGLGGGICQVSTTLYNVVLLTNLEVIERKPHAMHTGYVQPGRDATVVNGAIDFQFKNNRTYPIKIVCSVKDGFCKFEFYGMKQDTDPIVDIETKILNTVAPKTINENDPTMDVGTTKVVQTPMSGYTSETYKLIKNSAGEVLSRTLVSKDVYAVTNKIIKVGTKPVVVTPVEPAPQEETPVQPSTEPQEENNQQDNTIILPPGWDSPESPYVQ